MPFPTITVTPGTGTTVNTLPNAGAVTSANSLPVVLATDQATITVKAGDGTNFAGVVQGRNADNQVPSTLVYQLDVAASTGVLNNASNVNGVNAGAVDRVRGTGQDNIPGVGIPAGSSQFAISFSTTINQATVTAGNAPQTVTLTSATNVKVGDLLSVLGANPEVVFVTAVSGANVTGVFKATHVTTDPVQWFHYNVARDAASGDKIPLTGLSASMTYLFNNVTNQGELDRSAAGETDGASGTGTAVAAEYEYNGGGPVLAGGLSSGFTFDRARSVNAKGLGAGTITASVIGNTNLVFAGAANTNLLNPGSAVRLRGGANMEVVYVSQTFVAGSSATVPLQSPVVNAGQTTAEWDVYSVNGPGLNGFTCFGVGIEEEALFDPVTNLFFLERSATQDAMPMQNIVAEQGVLYNGATGDREKSLQGLQTTAATGRASMHPGLPVFTTLTAVAATTTGTALDCVTTHQTVTLQVNLAFTTAPAISTQLQGSLDNANFYAIGAPLTSAAAGTTAVFATGSPARYFRAATTITGGTGVTVTGLIGVAG